MSGVEFVTSALSDLALAPALLQVAKRRRHFELFIGSFQLLSAILYNASEAIQMPLFIDNIDWHFINDVTALTFACCLLVHCMGNTSEDTNIVLRYIAFACAWTFKYRDSWDSIVWEAALITIYVCLAIKGFLTLDARAQAQFDLVDLRRGIAFLTLALVLLLGGVVSSANINAYPFYVLSMHICAGGASYYLWKGIPSIDAYAKKTDLLGGQKPSTFM